MHRTHARANGQDLSIHATKRAFIQAANIGKKTLAKAGIKMWRDLKDQSEGITHKASKYMLKKPIKTLIGVGIVGVLLGMFLRRK